MNNINFKIILFFSICTHISALAQKDLASTISFDICICINASKDTSITAYNKCYANAFITYQKQISNEYNLTPKSTYTEAQQAGQKMRLRVENYLNQNCPSYKKQKK